LGKSRLRPSYQGRFRNNKESRTRTHNPMLSQLL
jgi:hypothetical protein